MAYHKLLRYGIYFIACAVLCSAVFFLPAINLKIGDLFFGRVPSLYNVHFAQFFYKQAAFPLVGYAEPYALYQLSRTYFIQGDGDRALTTADLELQKYPDHWQTYYIRGLTLGYMDREEEAIEAFANFLEHKPESWAARNDKAWLHFRIGDIDGAIETIEPAAELHIQNPWVMNTYGVLLMNVDRLEEAQKALRTAQATAATMTASEWGRAYPGNSPQVHVEGLQAMRLSIASNLEKIEEKLSAYNSDVEQNGGV